MTFDELLKLVRSSGEASRPRLCCDSRNIAAGDIFVAVKGHNFDGHEFIPQAITNGAKYIVHQNSVSPQVYPGGSSNRASSIEYRVSFVSVPDPSIALAILAQASTGDPASKLTNLAVTGTNGKTTVAFLVRSCFQAAGQKCGLIGTVIYDTGLDVTNADLTTPDCLTMAQAQSRMLNAGVKYMVVEASSHALDQNRLAAVPLKAAAFTNLTGDHLDYHKTTENYLVSKMKLFRSLAPEATAVINRQSPYAQQIAECTKAKILWYAIDEPAGLSAHVESINITGTTFTLRYQGKSLTIKTPLLGYYNVANHLAAVGLCLAAGLDLNEIAHGLGILPAIPGRLENVKPDAPFAVLVDYAHTDDALYNVLSTLKPLCKAKLIVVFGCGGDRDKTKRPRMAKVAEQFADLVIVTSDNPRTEDPDAIISQIVAGFADPNSPKIKAESDRRKAIALAIESAAENDVVLIAGKGHEAYQIVGVKRFAFSDKDVALECLQSRNA